MVSVIAGGCSAHHVWKERCISFAVVGVDGARVVELGVVADQHLFAEDNLGFLEAKGAFVFVILRRVEKSLNVKDRLMILFRVHLHNHNFYPNQIVVRYNLMTKKGGWILTDKSTSATPAEHLVGLGNVDGRASH